MVQRPKKGVRVAILQAAGLEFSDVGFERATIAAIAKRAATSIGNVYKYFANKDELFADAMPGDVAERFRALLQARIEAFGAEHDVHALGAEHPYRVASDELLRFILANRIKILFLLRRAEGTQYSSFAEDLAQNLSRLAKRYATRAYPNSTISVARQRALVRIYRSFLASMASMLEEEITEARIRQASVHFSAYHLAGLRAFFEAAAQEALEE
jgi:AcrR family transcriptional regulator